MFYSQTQEVINSFRGSLILMDHLRALSKKLSLLLLNKISCNHHVGTVNLPVRSRYMEIQSSWSTSKLLTVQGILCYNASMRLLLSSFLPLALDSEAEITDSISLQQSNHQPCSDLSINNSLSVRVALCNLKGKGLCLMLQKDWPEREKKCFCLHYSPKPSNPQHRHSSYRWVKSHGTWNKTDDAVEI